MIENCIRHVSKSNKEKQATATPMYPFHYPENLVHFGPSTLTILTAVCKVTFET